MAWFKFGAAGMRVEPARLPEVPLRPEPTVAEAAPLVPSARNVVAEAPAPKPAKPSKRELGRPLPDEFVTKKKSARVDALLADARENGPVQGELGQGTYRYSMDAAGLQSFIESGVLPVQQGRLVHAQESGAIGTHRVEFNLREGVELEPGVSLRPARHIDLTYLGPDPLARGEEALPLIPGAKSKPVKTAKRAPPPRSLEALGDDHTRAVEAGQTNLKAAQKLPPDLRKAAQQKIRMVLDATRVKELGELPGNRLERITAAGVNLPAKLVQSGEPIYSIRVNEQYRVAFNFTPGGKARNVFLVDYHRG